MTTVIQHFLWFCQFRPNWSMVGSAYPEVLNGVAVGGIGGTDEVVVTEVRSFG